MQYTPPTTFYPELDTYTFLWTDPVDWWQRVKSKLCGNF